MQDINETAKGHWPSILGALAGLSQQQLTDKHQPCPLCGGTDRYRFDDQDGNGSWFCNKCGGKTQSGGAGSGMDLLMRKNNWDFKRAASEVERHLGIAKSRPEPPVKNAEAHWYYNDDFVVARFKERDGGKTFRQYWFNGTKWQAKLPDHYKLANSKPLLNLGKVRATTGWVLVTEGEKACEAAAKYFPTLACTTWSGGCKGHGKTDFSPLKGRKVFLWPDADDEGRAAMQAVADKLLRLGAETVRIVVPPEGVPKGWDIADAEWNENEARDYLKHNYDEYTAPELIPETGEVPVDDEPEDDNSLDNSAPFRCLGHDRGSYYYLPRDGGQVIALSDSRHTKLGLLNLAPLGWWASSFPKGASVDWDEAADTLIKTCKDEGIFDPDRIRGRGAWYDSTRVIMHCGNRLTVVEQDKEPKHLDIDSPPQSWYFYEHAKSINGPSDEPLSDEVCAELVAIARQFSWEKTDASSAFLLGWIVLAPVCGALDWRPHIWLTGGAGTGKTTILKYFMRPLLGGLCQSATGGTTEAGLRGTLKSDAIPVVFDEFEQNEARDKQTVQNVLSLARIASSEGGKIYKGTTSGGANSFEIRSMFCVSSINVNLIQKADIDRFCVLGLMRDDSQKEDFWRKFEQRILASCTDDNGRQLIARTLKNIPVIRQNARIFSTALGRKFGARFGDQNGTLLAGFFSLSPDGCQVVNLETAIAMVESMNWEADKPDADEADEHKCLLHIVDSMVIVDGRRITLRELIGMAQRGAITATHGRDGSEDPNVVIARYGLKYHEGMLAISNNNSNLQSLLKETPWSGNAYKRSLSRLPGARKSSPLRYPAMGTSRATLVPLDGLI
jgi:putative DNA primase/helicase